VREPVTRADNSENHCVDVDNDGSVKNLTIRNVSYSSWSRWERLSIVVYNFSREIFLTSNKISIEI
jgi:hypothetical protein